MQTLKSVFGVTRALLPVLYFGGLAVYFLRVSGGSMEGVNLLGLGPTIIGLGAVGFLFCIPLLLKLGKLFSSTRPPGSGGGSPKGDDEDSGFDADAAIARYMAQRSPEPAPKAPPARPAARSSEPAPRPGFGRRIG